MKKPKLELIADTPTVEEISDLCKRLASVLDDPHPGLSTWHAARERFGHELRTALSAVLGPQTRKETTR